VISPRWGWALAAALVLPSLGGLIYAGASGSADPYGASGLRWDRVIEPAWRSAALAATVAVGAVLLGGFLGWGQARWAGGAVRWSAGLATLPLAVPSYVLAAAVGRAWSDAFGSPPNGQLAASAVLVLATAPLVQLAVAAALSRASAAEEEAARSLGASEAAIARAVHWPRLRPALALSGLSAALYAVSDFGVVAMLDVPVLTWKMVDAVSRQQLDRAALLGGLAFAAVAPSAAVVWWLRGAGLSGAVANSRPRAVSPVGPLRRASYVLVAGSVAALGAALPVLELGRWVVDGAQAGLPFASLVDPTLQTMLLAGGGALVLTALATVPALARRSTGLEAAVYASSVLPPVLVGFGWMGAALGLSRALGGRAVYGALLGSGVVLMAALSARFLAEAYGPLRAAALRVDPRWAEAAAVLGAPRRSWALRVVAPAMVPGALAALSVSSLVLAKELPIVLLLGAPVGLRPLSFRLWDRHAEALWHDAGAAGLLLVLLAAVGRVAALRAERRS
jgi:iron(III) transport system permease protein